MVEPSSYPSAAVALMKRMNPKWRDSSYSTIDTSAEKSLTDNYNVETGTQFVTYPASYAGACPSLEMFAKSYNVWKTGNPNGGIITPYIKNQYGYGLSALPTNIEYGPKNLYILSNALACWMASPSPASDAPYGASVFVLYGDTRTLGWKNVGGRNISYEPVVSIGTT